tara:strand:+ start:15104 stop:16216 length:1113 start_codon:yes stop_codon:yes gene_type:complete
LDKKLHIVSFSVPFPANYGGVIDVFYKLKSLYEAGVKVVLHCFQYDREPAEELDFFCEQVFYYPRKMKGAHLLGFYPFIVGSRSSEKLMENLLKDDAPILFEGLHTCLPVLDNRLKDRKKLVRSHNVEHNYYLALAKLERNPMKRLYYKTEARKLERFEPLAFNNADVVLGISKKDTIYLNGKYENAIHVSAFHGFEVVNIPEKTEDFSLYHGNLSVGENNQAALFLASDVFKGLKHKLIIAGNNPSVQLQKLVGQLSNVELKDDLSSGEINDLIHRAKINILPTFQSTGIKLKLLAALFNGGHCLVNDKMVQDTGLEGAVHIANSVKEFKEKVSELSLNSIGDNDVKTRKEILYNFRNDFNVKKLKGVI